MGTFARPVQILHCIAGFLRSANRRADFQCFQVISYMAKYRHSKGTFAKTSTLRRLEALQKARETLKRKLIMKFLSSYSKLHE